MLAKVVFLLLLFRISEIFGCQYNTETFTIAAHTSREVVHANDKKFIVLNVGKPSLKVEIYEVYFYGSFQRVEAKTPALSQVVVHGQTLEWSTKRYTPRILRVTNNDNITGFIHAFSWFYQYKEYDCFDQFHFSIDNYGLTQNAVKVSAVYLPSVNTLVEGPVELFWPEGKSVFEEIKASVQALIGTKTEERVKNILQEDIEPLRQRIGRCSREIHDPKLTKTTADNYMNIAEDIIGLEMMFAFEFYLLPFFSTVVNLKVKFYQFGLLHKEKVGLHQEHVERLVDYINTTVNDPSSGAIAHVNNICKKKLDDTYSGIYPEFIFDEFASLRSFCALYGYENFPVWESIASSSKVKHTEIPVIVFSTQFGRYTASQSSIMVVDPIPPPLQPKLINGKVNEPTSVRVYLTNDERIRGMKVYYENGDTAELVSPLDGNYVTIDFKGKKLMKLTARGSGKIDSLEFEFEDGRVEKAGKPDGNTRTFSLEKHHIVGFFMTRSLIINPDQAANIAVSYQAILPE